MDKAVRYCKVGICCQNMRYVGEDRWRCKNGHTITSPPTHFERAALEIEFFHPLVLGGPVSVGAVGAKANQVSSPAHYTQYPFEVKDAIAKLLDSDVCDKLTGWQAYCMGNILKYRLRAGHKGDAAEDIAKAMMYEKFMKGEDDV